MADYMERETAIKAIEKADCAVIADDAESCKTDYLREIIKSVPAANVAPIEALERLRDEMCAQDLITMEGLRKLNTLIWKYTTVHDGGADHAAD